MTNPSQAPTSILREGLSVLTFALVLFYLAITIAAQPAQAQTFTMLHSFTGGADGAAPFGSLTLDRAGNLFGTTSAGGYTGSGCVSPYGPGCGTVFELKRSGSHWIFTPLYSFRGHSDAATPYSGVTIGPNGSLYGTTIFGGNGSGFGTVYNLQPPAHAAGNALGDWIETVLYRFTGGSDGGNPAYGNVIFDPAGNIYGTTYNGGFDCEGYYCGTIFKLTPSGSGWLESAYYAFIGRDGGGNPLSGVVRDASGNLYGTTSYTGLWNPVAYKLTPGGIDSNLYTFASSVNPQGGVALDGSGNLFGTSFGIGITSTVYELSSTGGQWTYTLIDDFSGSDNQGPESGVVRDSDGNLYGTTCNDGSFGEGSVFKLMPSLGGWTHTDLYDFTGRDDGGCPVGGMAIDEAGNLYGTTSGGGQYRTGVVFEITP